MTFTPSIIVAVVGLLLLQAAASPYVLRRMRARGADPRLALALTLGLGVLALPLWVGAAFFGLDVDSHATFMWTWVGGVSAAGGLVAARAARGMAVFELTVALTLVFEAVALGVSFAHTGEGMASPAARALMAAPIAMALCGYFGVSLGTMLWGGGQGEVEWGFGYESLIGRRLLLSKASPVLSTVTTISLVGVALGVWLVIISLGVLAGFESDLRAKIIGANAHVVLQRPGGDAFEPAADALPAVGRLPGVLAAAPVIEGEVAAASSSNYTGVLLHGIDPTRSPGVLAVLHKIEQGSLQALADDQRRADAAAAAAAAAALPLPPHVNDAGAPDAGTDAGAPADAAAGEFLAPSPMPHIVIGIEMAKALNVGIGDVVRILSPTLEVLTPLGVAPKSLGFRVAGIFASAMYEYDARFAFTSLSAARRFFELSAREVSGIQLAVHDPEASAWVGDQAAALLGGGVQALDWRRRNQTLFSALKLERVVAFVVLVFIILVASFSIVNTLAMSVVEKRKEIAILKTMGARAVGVMKIFLVQGLIVGTFGTLSGAAMAVLTAWLLQQFGFWIPGEVYYIDSLPVRLEASDVVLVLLAALLIVWDFAVFPALSGSRLEPVEGLRDG